MPCGDLNTDTYRAEIQKIIEELPGAKVSAIAGEELHEKGFGGLWGVGKAAAHLPALVILEYHPAGASKTVALVGKGIMFDTGGLSMKGTTFMVGMKEDMGGSAAVLGAFRTLVKNNFNQNLYGLLCLGNSC
jgi:probable aminopeptidase NPEPL1